MKKRKPRSRILKLEVKAQSRANDPVVPIVYGDEDDVVIQQELWPVEVGVAGAGKPSATMEPDHDRMPLLGLCLALKRRIDV